MLSVTGAQPAAGADFSYVVAPVQYEIPLYVSCSFNTSNQVASRGVVIGFAVAGGVGTLGDWPAAATQAASIDIDYTFSIGTGTAYGPVAAFAAIPFPATVLLPGYTISVSANAIQTNDQFSSITVTTIHIPSGPTLAQPVSPVATPVLV